MSFRLEICDISRLFTHFSQLFPAVGSESHFFILLEVGKSVVCKSHEIIPDICRKTKFLQIPRYVPAGSGEAERRGEGERGGGITLTGTQQGLVLNC